MSAIPIVGGLAAGAGFMAWAARGRSAAVFGPSDWRGPQDRKRIALTFDDGPTDGTAHVLELLATHRVPGTFFQIGVNVERFPGIARAVRDGGHEIGNHSQTHPLMSLRSAEFIYNEFARAQRTIFDATGVTPAVLRAPYGVRWFGFGAAQRRLKLRAVMWSVIGYDWKLKADTIVDRVLPRVTNGTILCLHDGRELTDAPDIRQTVDAVGRLIPELRDQGYEFETVSRLLCPKIRLSESGK